MASLSYSIMTESVGRIIAGRVGDGGGLRRQCIGYTQYGDVWLVGSSLHMIYCIREVPLSLTNQV